jgi:putative ABC transport system permease protein
MKFIRNTDLHLNTDQVVVFETWRLKGSAKTEFTDRVQQIAGVSGIANADGSLFDGVNSTGSIEWPGKGKETHLQIAALEVDKEFMPFFHIKIKEGRGPEAVSGKNLLWLNETAVKKMGLQNPVGQSIQLRGDTGTVIGVVEDFHFQSMHNAMMPVVLKYEPENGGILYVRVQPQSTKAMVSAAEQVWKKHEPNLPMEYHFLNDQIAKLYDRETKASQLFDTFAIVTMLISCLGLFGLTTYSAERRIKEIGIRKVLGAGVGRIAVMLSTEFVKLVIIATIIAVPIVWYSMNKILQDFAYRTDLSWWVFALTALAAIGLALLTMSFQAIKAGMSNPVKSLHTE